MFKERLRIRTFSNKGSIRNIGPSHTAGKKNLGHIRGAMVNTDPMARNREDGLGFCFEERISDSDAAG
jgi:hypothetical protein